MTDVARSTSDAEPMRRAKGRQRVEEILAVAEDQLTRHGGEGLSVRAVAGALGMSVGNLQYYFATRAELVDSVFARHADRFTAELTERLADVPESDPRGQLLVLVDYWLHMQHDSSQALFWHLWAISAHDASARTTMMDVYDRLLARIIRGLRGMHPTLTPRAAHRRAAAICALVDGSGLFVGFGRHPAPDLVGLQEEIRADVVELIDRPPQGRRR